jgi:hypothetical protein
MKANEMERAHRTHGISEKNWQYFGMKSFKERSYLGYLSIIKDIILK